MGPIHTVGPVRTAPRRRVKLPAVPAAAVVQDPPAAPDSRQLAPQRPVVPPTAAGDVATSSTLGVAMTGPIHTAATSRVARRRRTKPPAVPAASVVQDPPAAPDHRQLDPRHLAVPTPTRPAVKPPAVSATTEVSTVSRQLLVHDSRRLDPPHSAEPPPLAVPQEWNPPVPRAVRRREEAVDPGPAARRQRTLLSWLGHGRAAEGFT